MAAINQYPIKSVIDEFDSDEINKITSELSGGLGKNLYTLLFKINKDRLANELHLLDSSIYNKILAIDGGVQELKSKGNFYGVDKSAVFLQVGKMYRNNNKKKYNLNQIVPLYDIDNQIYETKRFKSILPSGDLIINGCDSLYESYTKKINEFINDIEESFTDDMKRDIIRKKVVKGSAVYDKYMLLGREVFEIIKVFRLDVEQITKQQLQDGYTSKNVSIEVMGMSEQILMVGDLIFKSLDLDSKDNNTMVVMDGGISPRSLGNTWNKIKTLYKLISKDLDSKNIEIVGLLKHGKHVDVLDKISKSLKDSNNLGGTPIFLDVQKDLLIKNNFQSIKNETIGIILPTGDNYVLKVDSSVILDKDKLSNIATFLNEQKSQKYKNALMCNTTINDYVSVSRDNSSLITNKIKTIENHEVELLEVQKVKPKLKLY